MEGDERQKGAVTDRARASQRGGSNFDALIYQAVKVGSPHEWQDHRGFQRDAPPPSDCVLWLGPASSRSDRNASGMELASQGRFVNVECLGQCCERQATLVAIGCLSDVSGREFSNAPTALDPAGFKMSHDRSAMDFVSASQGVDRQSTDVLLDEVINGGVQESSLDRV